MEHRGHRGTEDTEKRFLIINHQSSIRNPQSAIRNPQSAIRNSRWQTVNYKQALEIDRKNVFQTYKRRPLLFVRGRGVYVYDDAGRRYLDFLGGLAVNALGHAHPRLAAAIAKQARTLGHTSNLYLTEPMLTLAQRLCALSDMDRVFF